MSIPILPPEDVLEYQSKSLHPLQWIDVIDHPSVNLILGFRRSGKTALGYYLTNTLGDIYKIKKVSFNFNPKYKKLLPKDFIITNSIQEIPKNSIVLVDEISTLAYARTFQKKSNQLLDQFTAFSGKNKQTIIYITHHSRKIDINLVTDVDTLIYKKPSLLQLSLDRTEIRPFALEAYNSLKDKDKSHSYVFSFTKDLRGLLTNPLPEFWSQELSDLVHLNDNDNLSLPPLPKVKKNQKKVNNQINQKKGKGKSVFRKIFG